jgi:putative NADH-flavin reductase
MKLIIFGASGPTGRLLTTQALAAGHDVTAVTRRPDSFPITDPRLGVAAVDVYDATAVADGVAGADAVLSTLGVPFTRKPITTYSVGTGHIVDAMSRHGVKRLAVVSSSATEPHDHAGAGFLFNRVMQPMVVNTIGKTTYADMRAMESAVRASDLEWTIVRPSGLFNAPGVTAYRLDEDRADGTFTARADLAAALLAQVTDDRFSRRAVAVTTTEIKPNLAKLIWQEGIRKRA